MKNQPGSAALFEEPTYLDCVNALVPEWFQYQILNEPKFDRRDNSKQKPDRQEGPSLTVGLLLVRRREPAGRDAGERPAQANAAPLHILQSVVRQDERQPCGNSVVR